MHPPSVSSSLFLRVFGLAALASALAAQAQVAPDAPGTDASSSSEERQGGNQVVVLSAFEVSTKASNEYVASESVTGTRIASQLRDLPFQVNVITAEFMNDFAAYEMPDQLGFVSNISPSESQGEFQLRGFPSTPFVDGFRRLGNVNIVNTQRVEVIKGLAASIYGQVLPGGVVNYITRKPGSKTEHKIDVSIGSDDFRRFNASTTGPAGSSGKFFHRIDLSKQTRGFYQDFADRDTVFGSGQLLWKPAEATSVTLKLDYSETFNHDPRPLPWVRTANGGQSNTTARGVTDAAGNQLTYNFIANTGGTAGSQQTGNAPLPQVINRFTNHPDDIAGYLAYLANPTGTPFVAQYGRLRTVSNSYDALDYSLARARFDAWGGFSRSELASGTLTADHRFNSIFSSRATIDYYNREYNRQSNHNNNVTYNESIPVPAPPSPNEGRQTSAYADGKFGGTAPTWQTANSRALTMQVDTLAQFHTGPLKHKLLFTVDFADQRKYDQSIRIPIPDGDGISGPNGQPVSQRLSDHVVDTRLGYPVVWPLVIPGGPGSTGNGRLTFPWTAETYAFPLFEEFPGLYTERREDRVVTNTDLGLFMSERVSFWQDRITLLAGARVDIMRNTALNYMDPSPTPTRVVWNTDAFTHQVGFSANVTKNLTLFANDSSTYNPNPQVMTNRQTGELLLFPNEEGSGYEYGFRIAMFDKRVNIGVSQFNITRENVLDSLVNEFGETEYVADGTQRSKGYEIDFNISVTENLQLIGGYGYNDARYSYSSLPYLIDQTTPRSPKDNLGVALKYQIRSGKLRGLSFTAGARYLSESLISLGNGGTLHTNPYGPSEVSSNNFVPIIFNNPLYNGALPFRDLPQGIAILSRNNPNAIGTLDPSGTGRRLQDPGANRGWVTSNRTGNQLLVPSNWVEYQPGMTLVEGTQYYIMDGDGQSSASYKYSTTVDDGRSQIFNKSYVIWEFGVQYSFRTHNRKLRHTMRLNVKNAFDNFYTYGAGAVGDPRQFIGSYSLTF